MNIIDLFCGTGGFSTGFEASGKFVVKAGLDILGDRLNTFATNHKSAYVIKEDIKK